jgi:hypothetical protein
MKIENIKLDNGKILNRLYGKYLPNLIIISDKELSTYWRGDLAVPSEEADKILETLNIPFDGKPIVIKGQFRVNAKGNRIFDTTKGGHILLAVSWGGAFNKSRGLDESKIDGCFYFRSASSNGGGTGWDYVLVPENFSMKFSEDDF